jgi:hypothetical protein
MADLPRRTQSAVARAVGETAPNEPDEFTENTRKERRALLGLSVVAIVVAQGGVLPTEFTTLGLKFSETDQRVLLKVLALVQGYFLVAFMAYAASDYAWRRWAGSYRLNLAFLAALEKERQAELARRAGAAQGGEDADEPEMTVNTAAPIVPPWFVTSAFFARYVVELVVPTVFGLYALVVVLWRAFR